MTLDEWIEEQLAKAPEPTDAQMRRISYLLFGPP